MANHKKAHHEEHIDETWLIPYADLLTLLLALFIVLYSISSVDATKFKQLAETFSTVFTGGSDIMQYPSPNENPINMNSLAKNENVNKLAAKEKENLEKLQKKVNELITEKNLSLSVKTILTNEGLTILILNDVLFDSGSADVRKENYPLIKEISNLLLLSEPREIIVSGHTDNVPISTSKFPSNWELSAMRAVNFMKLLLEENKKLDPSHLSARGFGEYRPIVSNDTEDGRRQNRRVEILIKASTDMEIKK